MRDGARRNAEERLMFSTGVSMCRACKVVKELSEFYSRHARCITCCREAAQQYKRRNRVNDLRERRVQHLAKSLKRVMDGGDCPVCGNAEHDQECLIRKLEIQLVRMGWSVKRYWKEATA